MTDEDKNKEALIEELKALRKELSEIKAAKTASEENEARLKEIENNFNTLTTHAPVGIFLDDASGKAVYINNKCAELIGVPPENALNLNWLVYMHKDDRVWMLKAWNKAVATGTSFHEEYRWVHEDGKVIWTVGDVVPVKDREGRITNFVGTLVDITAAKKAEDELRKMEKLKSIGMLAGGIAHDFNNILMGIFGNIEIAKEQLPKNHPVCKYLEEATSSMNRAVRLTKQLLTFAKGGEPVTQDVDICSLIEEIANFDLSGSNVRPVFYVADDLRAAKVDKGQIQQVFSNLVINAKEAMPNGGKLHISLNNAHVSSGEIPGLRAGKYIKLSVKDEGIGIEAKHLGQIFDPYFSTKPGGSGLGLTIAYSIMHKHGGSVLVESKPGQGTTFSLYLPVAESGKKEKPAIRKDAVVPQVKKRTGRILIMDDEEAVRDVLSAILKRLDYSVEATADGLAAIDAYKKSMEAGTPFDAVILDLTIKGGIGGKDAIEGILDIDPKAKCIVSSGYTDDDVMANYADYGFRDIIAKPYTMAKLKDVLDNLAG